MEKVGWMMLNFFSNSSMVSGNSSVSVNLLRVLYFSVNIPTFSEKIKMGYDLNFEMMTKNLCEDFKAQSYEKSYKFA